MRATDAYSILLSMTAGFAAVVGWEAGFPRAVTVSLAIVAVIVATAALVRRQRTPDVLLVGERFGHPLYETRQRIDDLGLGLRTCRGPGAHACPVLNGEPCPVGGMHVHAMLAGDAADAPCGEWFHIPSEVVDLAAQRVI